MPTTPSPEPGSWLAWPVPQAELDFSKPEWPPRCPQCKGGDIDLIPGQPAQCTRCGHHWPMEPPENVTGPVHYVHDSDHAGGKETKG